MQTTSVGLDHLLRVIGDPVAELGDMLCYFTNQAVAATAPMHTARCVHAHNA
jgi:hypothetical protein